MHTRPLLYFCSCLLFLTGCAGVFPQTAAATPQPVSPEAMSAEVVRQVNDFLMNNMDPIGYVLDAKFQVVDAAYDVKGDNQFVGLYIDIDCRGLCSRERTFSVGMQALKTKYPNLRAILPDTLKELHIKALDQMKSTGEIIVKWKDAGAYFNNTLTGPQLASRIEKNP